MYHENIIEKVVNKIFICILTEIVSFIKLRMCKRKEDETSKKLNK